MRTHLGGLDASRRISFFAPAGLEAVISVMVLMISLLWLADKNGDLNKVLKLNQIL